jgi:hypothetical protein
MIPHQRKQGVLFQQVGGFRQGLLAAFRGEPGVALVLHTDGLSEVLAEDVRLP